MTRPATLASTPPDFVTPVLREVMIKELRLDLEPDPTAAASARAAVREALGWWGERELRQTAIIVVSEMVANAVRHAAPPYTLSIGLTENHLLAVVGDASNQLPVMRDPSPAKGGGWGLQLVSQLTDSWGVEPSAPGKLVWAAIDRW